MSRHRGRIRKAASAGISVLMLTLSVAIPVLERADLVGEPVAESEHDPASCPPAHDHTVCTQVTANLSLPAGSCDARLTRVVLYAAPSTDVVRTSFGTFSEGHPSRAPPLG